MRWLVRNWHLKLAAVALATILYTGFVYSDSFTEQQFQGASVQAINQPEGTYLLTQQLGSVDIRYRLAADGPERVTADSFSVSLDLGGYDMDRVAEPQAVPIDVRPFTDGVDILEWTPTSISVQLDRLAEKEVRVVVDRGDIPEGLEIASPSVDPRRVTARGPATQLGRVDHAVARVAIDQSGIDVSNRSVTLVPVDADGSEVNAVDLEPETATVDIDVSTVDTTKTVAIVPNLVGQPATGFEILSVTIQPAVVTLRGVPGALTGVEEVTTQPISIAGATATRTVNVELVLPPDVTLADEDPDPPVATIELRSQTATRTFLVGPDCSGGAAGVACLPQQSQVAVRLSGPAAGLDALSAVDLNATLDVSGLAPGTHSVSVTIVLPDGFELMSISPATVTVVLQAPATPSPTPPPT